MTKKNIGIIIGSLRKGSFSRSIANALIELAPEALAAHIVEIGNLQLYNQDMDDEGNTPESYPQFRKEIAALDGVLFVTPEYNRSMPAVLKNALDVASRPYGQNQWNGKPGAIVSVSMGAMGGMAANLALRQPMVFLNVPLMQQPEAYIGKAQDLLDDKGVLVNESTRAFLQNYMEAYAEWVKTLSPKR